MLKYHPIDLQAVEFIVDDTPVSYSASVLATVDTIWQQACDQAEKTLTNDSVLSVTEISGSAITVQITEYRYLYAQLMQPELYQQLQLRALAVSGILECPEGMVFGLRANAVSQYPNHWELVPSGGVNGNLPIDYQRQLLTELTEELGTPKQMIERLTPFVLVEDTDSHVVDIAVHLATSWPYKQIATWFDRLPNKEYQQLAVVASSALNSFLATEQVVNITEVVLAEWDRFKNEQNRL